MSINGSTAAELDAWCRVHLPSSRRFLGVFESNTIACKLPAPCCLIVSYGAHRHGSTNVLHWCAINIDSAGHGRWLDPMGKAPGADFSFRTPFEAILRRSCPNGFSWNTKRLEQYEGIVSGIASTDCGQWSCFMLLHGDPVQNPAAYRWVTSSPTITARRLLEKVRLT